MSSGKNNTNKSTTGGGATDVEARWTFACGLARSGNPDILNKILSGDIPAPTPEHLWNLATGLALGGNALVLNAILSGQVPVPSQEDLTRFQDEYDQEQKKTSTQSMQPSRPKRARDSNSSTPPAFSKGTPPSSLTFGSARKVPVSLGINGAGGPVTRRPLAFSPSVHSASVGGGLGFSSPSVPSGQMMMSPSIPSGQMMMSSPFAAASLAGGASIATASTGSGFNHNNATGSFVVGGAGSDNAEYQAFLAYRNMQPHVKRIMDDLKNNKRAQASKLSVESDNARAGVTGNLSFEDAVLIIMALLDRVEVLEAQVGAFIQDQNGV